MALIDALYGKTNLLLEKSMQLRMARHGMLASNIANSETPNYRAVDIDFRETMNRYLEGYKVNELPHSLEVKKADSRHVGFGDLNPPLEERHIVFAAGDGTSVGNDNNSVNMEEQLARMQANTMMYKASTQILQKKLSGMKNLLEQTSRT